MEYYWFERWTGGFERSISLPAEVGADKINGTFRNRVLEVYLPKVAKARGKKIEIKVG